MLADVCMCCFSQPLVLSKLPQGNIPYTICMWPVVLASLTDRSGECFLIYCKTSSLPMLCVMEILGFKTPLCGYRKHLTAPSNSTAMTCRYTQATTSESESAL